MASKQKYDYDDDDECCGYVGGEAGQLGPANGYACPDFGPIKHVGDRLQASGEPHEYLGHFRQQKFARAGHNDLDATGKINNADDQNSYVGNTEQGVAPGSSASSVGQFASISGEGNPL